jgi:hypothetical protein
VVFERARLALVRVAGDVTRPAGLLVHELPLHACREARTAATTQTGRLHHLDNLVGRMRSERLLQRVVPAMLQVEVERERVPLANVFREDRIHQTVSNQLPDS